MPELPSDVQPYKRTPLFNQASVPTGLLNEHNTKAGTWGVLNVESGSLLYRITDPEQLCAFELNPSRKGIIAPQQPHHIELIGPVSFYVEFYRQP